MPGVVLHNDIVLYNSIHQESVITGHLEGTRTVRTVTAACRGQLIAGAAKAGGAALRLLAACRMVWAIWRLAGTAEPAFLFSCSRYCRNSPLSAPPAQPVTVLLPATICRFRPTSECEYEPVTGRLHAFARQRGWGVTALSLSLSNTCWPLLKPRRRRMHLPGASCI
jgi:hypothetical protein